jgi:hypothetical protein
VDDSLTTIVKTGACEFHIKPTPEDAVGTLGPVQMCLKTGSADVFEWLHMGEALALIAALQLVVDGVEREGHEAFAAHIAGKLAGKKFVEVPVGVSADA